MAYLAETHDSRIVNALTIDVEDYFQVSALAPYIPRSQWEAIPCGIEQNIARILEMLDEHKVKATFFTLAWGPGRYPELVRRLAAAGHEVASDAHAHDRAPDQSPTACLAAF